MAVLREPGLLSAQNERPIFGSFIRTKHLREPLGAWRWRSRLQSFASLVLVLLLGRTRTPKFLIPGPGNSKPAAPRRRAPPCLDPGSQCFFDSSGSFSRGSSALLDKENGGSYS